jgi:hypothetical protein
MANGILGSADLAAVTYTGVYTVPTSTFSVVSVSFCNKNATPVTIRLALAKPGEALPQGDDYLEYETEILPNGVLERTGIVLEEDRKIFARSSTTNTVVVVSGIETATA